MNAVGSGFCFYVFSSFIEIQLTKHVLVIDVQCNDLICIKIRYLKVMFANLKGKQYSLMEDN